jgi:hypothetical protein
MAYFARGWVMEMNETDFDTLWADFLDVPIDLEHQIAVFPFFLGRIKALLKNKETISKEELCDALKKSIQHATSI